jgi:VIT1/CCC1 family predicted Fe2+/Mn2+ transporter
LFSFCFVLSPLSLDSYVRTHKCSCNLGAIFGGIDGLTTTFSLVTTVVGAQLSSVVIVIVGLAHLFSDGIALGLGDLLFSQSDAQASHQQMSQEAEMYDMDLSHRIDVLKHKYIEKGMSEGDAYAVASTFARHKQVFVEMMMIEELGYAPVDEATHTKEALASGAITTFSYAGFGMLPLLPFLISLHPTIHNHLAWEIQVYTSLFLSIVTLFVVGACKARYVDHNVNWCFPATVVLANGCVAAGIGYVIGFSLHTLLSDFGDGLHFYQ